MEMIRPNIDLLSLVLAFAGIGQQLTLNHDRGSLELMGCSPDECKVGQIGRVLSSSNFTWGKQDNLLEQLATFFGRFKGPNLLESQALPRTGNYTKTFV